MAAPQKLSKAIFVNKITALEKAGTEESLKEVEVLKENMKLLESLGMLSSGTRSGRTLSQKQIEAKKLIEEAFYSMIAKHETFKPAFQDLIGTNFTDSKGKLKQIVRARVYFDTKIMKTNGTIAETNNNSNSETEPTDSELANIEENAIADEVAEALDSQ